MAPLTTPPFHADHVGSLIRPQELRDARQAHLEGRLPAPGPATIVSVRAHGARPAERKLERLVATARDIWG